MKTFYIVRTGWNAANQSAMRRTANPKNDFESGRCDLVEIIDGESESEVIDRCTATVYNNQYLTAYTNPRSVAGLTQAIRNFYTTGDC